MKRIISSLLLVLSVALMLVFSSCGDKEDESVFIAAEILGTWTTESTSVNATINGQDFLDFLKNNGVPEADIDEAKEELQVYGDEFIQWTITFNEDNTITSQYEGESETEGTWSLDEENKKLSIFNEEEVITEFEDLFSFDVLNLDTSKMTLLWGFQFDDFFGEGVEIDFDQDGTPDTFRMEIIMNFTK